MFERRRVDGLDWTVRRGLPEAALAGLVQTIRAPNRAPQCTVIKDNNVRTAALCRSADVRLGTVFVKRYKSRRAGDVCKHLVVPSKARSEWNALRLFERVGLPCPRPLAFFEQRSLGRLRDSALVVEALDGAVPLIEYVDAPARDLPVAGAVALARDLARYVRRMHDAGIMHRDLHGGNILVQVGVDGVPRLFFIDLHRALRLPRLSGGMRRRDLAQLCNSLAVRSAQKIRFLHEYCRAGMPLDARALQRPIQDLARRLEKRRVLSRSKRCVKKSTVFTRERFRAGRCFVRRDFGRAAAERVIVAHGALCSGEGAAVLKRATRSVLTVQRDAGGTPVCVKEYCRVGWVRALAQGLCGTRAAWSWRAAHGLQVRGFDTPLPLALIERGRGPLVRESFLLTRYLEGADELNDFVQGLCREDPGARRAFLRQLAATLRAMHERGIYHADLKSNNILVLPRGPESWGFYFIDLDRVYFHRRLTFARRANNLAQLNASVAACVSARDRLRFFRDYAHGSSCGAERKRYYRRVLAISRKKITAPYGVSFS